MTVVDPLQYAGWDNSVWSQPNALFCHGTPWTRVLADTYGHKPFYVCKTRQGQIEAALPLMEVASPLTGRRGVSLPFIDGCQPLARDSEESRALLQKAMELGAERGWKYLECRSGAEWWPGASSSVTFHNHTVFLEKKETLFDRLDPAVRRAIRKAGREGVRVELKRGVEAMNEFYALHCLTRRRHGLPPQPHQFFESIARHVIEPGHGWVASASRQGRTVAAAVFFHHGRTALYKYGASDQRYQHLRANDLVMWEAIRWYAANGFAALDLGRTSIAHEGLRRFKLGFAARESQLTYCRYDFRCRNFVQTPDGVDGWFNHVFRWQPLPLLRLAGRLLYPHLS